MPELLGVRRPSPDSAINGLISMTPDGHPLLGEVPEVRGLWSAAASWIKEGPGCGRVVAEARVGPGDHGRRARGGRRAASTRRPVPPPTCGTGRRRPSTRCMASSTRASSTSPPGPLRVSPLHERTTALGAVFFETARWERPQWYASNEPLLEKYAGRIMERPAEWESRWWSPIINAEHLALREGAGLVDLSAFTVLDVTGPDALAGLQNLAVAQLDVPRPGRSCTSFLNEAVTLRRRP